MVGLAQAQKLNWVDLTLVAPVINDFEQIYKAKKAKLQIETVKKESVRLTLSETAWYNKGPSVLLGESCKIARELQTLKEMAGRTKFEVEFALTLSKKVRGTYRVSVTSADCKK